MTPWEIIFWACAGFVAYPYLVYPLVLAALARLCGRPVRRAPGTVRSVSFVVCAHNEERAMDRRLTELCELIAASGVEGEVILVSDGSTDGTAALARAHTKAQVRVVELPERVGKAVALSQGAALASGEVLVFADVRQAWAPDALRLLLENFADPQIGAVSGDLVLRDADGALRGVSLYWRYEKLLRRLSSRLGSMVGATGAISAVRRELFRPIPAGTLLDDVWWPLEVVVQGRRVVHDERAVAYDRLPDRARDELRRKVRTLAGNFQLVARMPKALLPWRNPVALQLVSHKLLRLAVPWALAGMLIACLMLPEPFYRVTLGCQFAGYLAAVLGFVPPVGRQSRVASAAASFLVLNAAAWAAFWVWITGRAGRAWGKVVYGPAPVGRAVAVGTGARPWAS